MNSGQSKPASLIRAVRFASVSVFLVTFIGGILYVFWMGRAPAHASFEMHSEIDIGGPLLVGVTIAVMLLPLTLGFTFGLGLPFFHFWKRIGYSSVTAYVIGGLIVSVVAAAIIAMAHILLSDFLTLGSDFSFAMLLIAVSGPVAGFVVWYVLRRSSQQRTQAGDH